MIKEFELLTDERVNRIKSQKAKCLVNIRGVTSWKMLSLYPLLLDDEIEVIERAILSSRKGKHENKVFIRACPVTPRHGVLESASTHLVTEGVDIYNRIRNTMLDEDGDGYEPEGCMIIQPFVEATSSAVLAPNQYIAIGTGHDGITAGHGFNIVLPLDSDNECVSTYSFMESLKGESLDKVELEFIHKENKSYLTQVRRCPEHAPIGDARIMIVGQEDSFAGFIAHNAEEVKVSEVFVVNDLTDVATMEKVVHGDMPEGFVIVEPNGSVLSHAAAHSRGHNVSYSSCMVEVGDVIVSSNNYDYMDYKAYFMRGVEHARRNWKGNWGWLSTFFHQFVADPYCDAKDCAFFAGCYVGWMANAGLAACIGEARHARHAMASYNPAIAVVLSKLTMKGLNPSTNREDYYNYLDKQTLPYEDIVAGYEWSSKIFSHTTWASSYGGAKWANCADTLYDLTKAIMTGDASKIVSAANKAENINHNGGWLFNKFVPKEALDFGTGGFRAYGNYVDRMFALFELVNGMREECGAENDYRIPSIKSVKPTWSDIINNDISQYDIDELCETWTIPKIGSQSDCPDAGCKWCSTVSVSYDGGAFGNNLVSGSYEVWLVGDKIYHMPEAGEEIEMSWESAIQLMKDAHFIDKQLFAYIFHEVSISDNDLIDAWNEAIINAIPKAHLLPQQSSTSFYSTYDMEHHAIHYGCAIAKGFSDAYDESEYGDCYKGVMPESIDLTNMIVDDVGVMHCHIDWMDNLEE